MKRVLVVAYFYPPVGGGGVYRTLGFVRHLRDVGFEPVVLTGAGAPSWVSDPDLAAAVEGAEVVRAGGALVPASRTAARPAWTGALASLSRWLAVPDAYALWGHAAARAGIDRVRRGGIDAIYSTSPPDTDHLVALRIHNATGLPWLADFRDPWIGLTYRTPPTGVHRAAHERMLREVLAGARLVVAATEGTARWLEAAGGPGLRTHVIPNGYEAEEWSRVTPRRFERFTVLHAGRLSGERTIQPFLDGLAVFTGRDPARRSQMQVLLLGPHDEAQERLVGRSGWSDVVRFAGQRPHTETLAMEAGADLLLVVQSSAAEFRDLVPGKLYECLGAGRPVLAIVSEGPAAELVRRLGMGWVADPGAPGAVADALEAAWTRSFTPRHAASDREPHTRRALTAKLARLLGEIT